jgi:hypothetical protein
MWKWTLRLSEPPKRWISVTAPGMMVSLDAGLKPGRVIAATSRYEVTVTSDIPGGFTIIDWKNEPFTLRHEQSSSADPERPDWGRTLLKQRDRTQVLAGGSADLLWAGDLDRDGRLDLVLRIADNDIGSCLYSLFLSSAGKPFGEHVAQWRTHGC